MVFVVGGAPIGYEAILLAAIASMVSVEIPFVSFEISTLNVHCIEQGGFIFGWYHSTFIYLAPSCLLAKFRL